MLVVFVCLCVCGVGGKGLGGECLCYVLMRFCVEDGSIFDVMLCWLTVSLLM